MANRGAGGPRTRTPRGNRQPLDRYSRPPTPETERPLTPETERVTRVPETRVPSPVPGPIVSFRAAVMAGLVGGLAFLVFELLMVPLVYGASMWDPVRMIAAIAMGPGVLPPPSTFDLGIFLVAATLHFALSVAYAIGLAALLTWAGVRRATVVGTAFGLGLYLINFYGFTALYPWFADARNWVSALAHVVFGAVTGRAYVSALMRPKPVSPA